MTFDLDKFNDTRRGLPSPEVWRVGSHYQFKVYPSLSSLSLRPWSHHGVKAGPRRTISKLLFKEGVIVIRKDVHILKHLELADKTVSNLPVMKPIVPQISRLHEGTVSMETFPLVCYQPGYPLSPRLSPPPPDTVPELRLFLKLVWRGSDLQDSQEEKPKETRSESTGPWCWQKAEVRPGSKAEFQLSGGFGCGCGQSSQWSLEGIILCWKNLYPGGKKKFT